MLSVPGAPEKVKAVVSSSSEIVVSWLAPIQPRGRITHYTVHWAGPGTRSHSTMKRVDAHVTHALLQGLDMSTHQASTSKLTTL